MSLRSRFWSRCSLCCLQEERGSRRRGHPARGCAASAPPTQRRGSAPTSAARRAPAAAFTPPSYDAAFIQSLIDDWTLSTPLSPRSPSDPYAQPVPPDDPAGTVCAVLPTGDAGATRARTMLVTYPSADAATAAGAHPTHFGHCGVCSTLDQPGRLHARERSDQARARLRVRHQHRRRQPRSAVPPAASASICRARRSGPTTRRNTGHVCLDALLHQLHRSVQPARRHAQRRACSATKTRAAPSSRRSPDARAATPACRTRSAGRAAKCSRSCTPTDEAASHLRDAAVDEQLGAGDVAALVRREKRHRLGDLARLPDAPERHALDELASRSPPPASASLRSPGVSMTPGLTTLTRILRLRRSVVKVRANERKTALVAL